MTFDEVNDDLVLPPKPFKVVAALAVHGRLPLLEHTIRRLYEKNGCAKVICSGDNPDDMKLCQSLDAIWVHARNKPLGKKWNAAFQRARDLNPDAVLYVGSSDFVCDNWINMMRPYIERHGFAGVPGCSLADMGETLRAMHWKGYDGYRPARALETIGSGRMLSRSVMDALSWEPFDPLLDNSLDWSMKNRAALVGYTDFMVRDTSFKSLSLSTPLWKQKHVFEMHWDGRIPSEVIHNPEQWLSEYFPEVLELHEKLKQSILSLQPNK